VRILRTISQNEVAETFLHGELASTRFGKEAAAAAAAAPDAWVALHKYRGDYLSGLPEDIVWQRALLTRDELADVRYIDWHYWVDITGGTRLPKDTSDRATYADFAPKADEFHELILVGRAGGYLVVLEGHVRLTALMLDPPPELEVIVGLSDQIERWPLY
jgi:hypothetical protein